MTEKINIYYYKSWGTIKDTTNLLKVKLEIIIYETNKFQAFTNVDVTNKESKLVSNHLDYNTILELQNYLDLQQLQAKKFHLY